MTDVLRLPTLEPFTWASKCIPTTVLDKYGAGMDSSGHVISPHYSPDMELLAYHSRTPGLRDFRMRGRNVPLGLHLLGNHKELIIVEGHTDTYSAATVFPECDVIGLPGSDTVKSLLPYMSYMRKYQKITVMVDNDTAGHKAQQALIDILPPAKTHVVTLDEGLDVGDYLVSKRTDDLTNLYKLAARVHNTTFMSRDDCDKVVDKGDAVVMPTGFPSLDALLDGGLAVGDMSVLTGYTGRGKSAFIGNLAVNMAKQGVKVMYVAGEMSPDQTTRRLARQWNQAKLPIDKQQQREFLYPVVDNMYIDKSRDFTTRAVIERIQRAVIDYDARLVVIDVLSDIYSGDYTELNRTLTKLNDIAKGVFEDNIPGCHVLVVAHPKGDEDGPVDMNKLKGSSNIRQECCNVIAFNEVTPGSGTDTRRTLSLLKAGRNSDGERGTVTVDYDKYSQTYTEIQDASNTQDNTQGVRLTTRRKLSQEQSTSRVSPKCDIHVGTSEEATTLGGTNEDSESSTADTLNTLSEPIPPGLLQPTDQHVRGDEGDTQTGRQDEVTTGDTDAPTHEVPVGSTDDAHSEHRSITSTTSTPQYSGTDGRLCALQRMYSKHPEILRQHLNTYKTNNFIRDNLTALGYHLQ